MAKPKIAVSIADIPINVDLDNILTIIADAKVDGVELVLGFKSKIFERNVLKALNNFGLKILSIHLPVWHSFGLIESQTFEFAQRNAASVTFHPSQMKNYFSKISKLCSIYKIEACLENLPKKYWLWPFTMITPPAKFSNFTTISSIANKHGFGITLDVCHLQQPNPSKQISDPKIFRQVKNIHLSSFDDINQHLALGAGKFDHKVFLNFLKQRKYCNQVTLELSPHFLVNPKKYLEQTTASLALIKNHL